MKNRCVIQLGERELYKGSTIRLGYMYYVTKEGYESAVLHWARVYGSRSEAKKQLPKWLPEWPDAKIVDAGEVV